jgi:hypothetical protein
MKTNLIVTMIGAAYFGCTVISNALENSGSINQSFSELKQLPNLSDGDLEALNKAEPMVLDMNGKTGLEKDDKNRWSEYLSSNELLKRLDANVALQLSLGLLSHSSTDDYLRQLAIGILADNSKIDIQSSRQLIDVMIMLDRCSDDDSRPYERRWMSVGGLKRRTSWIIDGALHISPTQALNIPFNFVLPNSNSTPWLLKTLELAKTMPANQGNIPLIDSDIQYVKEKTNSSGNQ